MSPLDIQWRKSSHSSGQGGNCVEVASLASVVAVRDSKDPGGPSLAFDATAWRAFMRRVKSSVFEADVERADQEASRIRQYLDAGQTPPGYEVYTREQVISDDWLE